MVEPVNILVIDDEPVICNGCSVVLSEKEHLVNTCMTGMLGLEAIHRDEYDVLLLDLKLPDMDGMEILRTVRKKKPNLYIIIMTGFSTVNSAVEAMKLGAFDYLTKPFSDDELLIAVERVLEKKQLVDENRFLRARIIDQFGFHNIVGETPEIMKIFEQIAKVAPMDSTVIIYGESGTGKELFASAIHAHSRRVTGPFIALDCTTLNPSLLESELFGHVKGAFTGAIQDKPGIFEMAHKGTLFLDEVANLNGEIQGKLLRVLETREYKPVGGDQIKKMDVRVIAATNRDLKVMVDEGAFREDLFYRLNVFPVFIPPLRKRKDDIPKLAYHFLRHFCRKTGRNATGFTDDALEILINYDWPGNVRQLKNAIERLVIMADDKSTLDLFHLIDHLNIGQHCTEDSTPKNLEELKKLKKHLMEDYFGRIEKAFLLKALKGSGGNITHAAKKVGMKRPNFSTMMKKHKLSVMDSGGDTTSGTL